MTAQAQAPRRLHVQNIFWITVAHVMAVYAFNFFTWEAFALCIILLFTISPIGVNLTYHRLLTHRGFKVPQWFEYVLATIGTLSAQGPVMIWVAEHRLHHRYSDTDKDPHNSRKGFWWSHVGHLFYHKDFEDNREQWLKYVPDMSSHRYYHFLNDYSIWIALLQIPILYLLGGLPYLFWGGFFRVFLMLHGTWFVNSASHMFGYRNYETREYSTNCWWAALLAAGEGWHNNHHAVANCARHGHKWWEFDLTWCYIRLFEMVGLVTDVKRPPVMAPGAALMADPEPGY